VAVARVGKGSRVAATDPLQSFVAGLSVSALRRLRHFEYLNAMPESGRSPITSNSPFDVDWNSGHASAG